MSADIVFTKDNLDSCLRALGKEFRRLNGKRVPAEIILIGGAAVLINYGFRDMTYDIDAVIQATSAMKDAINTVGDSLGLPNGWMNSDFIKTKSYSPKLSQCSVYYKTFSNVLTVRTVSGEYLVAMKLMSQRQYKNDISDIIGILWEQQQRGKPITISDIDRAVTELYDGWQNMPDESQQLIKSILKSNNTEKLYQQYRSEEIANREALLVFEKDYPDITKEDNLKDIIANLKARKLKEHEH
ncbi:MAG: DUF6036 family nucleotidyltransferase [Lachnospiraceae bacterium]|nr:DUF6036 family nucleotidyltransferase [Lachnospiraceae bacterium]